MMANAGLWWWTVTFYQVVLGFLRKENHRQKTTNGPNKATSSLVVLPAPSAAKIAHFEPSFRWVRCKRGRDQVRHQDVVSIRARCSHSIMVYDHLPWSNLRMTLLGDKYWPSGQIMRTKKAVLPTVAALGHRLASSVCLIVLISICEGDSSTKIQLNRMKPSNSSGHTPIGMLQVSHRSTWPCNLLMTLSSVMRGLLILPCRRTFTVLRLLAIRLSHWTCTDAFN